MDERSIGPADVDPGAMELEAVRKLGLEVNGSRGLSPLPSRLSMTRSCHTGRGLSRILELVRNLVNFDRVPSESSGSWTLGARFLWCWC